MNQRFCHRCEAELPAHDEGTLIFCTQCGAPQILLSEELRAQAEEQLEPAAEGARDTADKRDTSANVWAGALHCVLLAAAVTAGLACLSALLPAVGIFTSLWAVVSPVVVIGLFQSRYPLAPMNVSFGARVGLLTGMAVAVALGCVVTISELLQRFAMHQPNGFDKWWALTLDQAPARLAGQSAADIAATMQTFAIPEFHAGVLLFCVALLAVMLLIITTAGGAFAGLVRQRTPRS